MKRSTDRMLTTHAGSLPQPSDLDAMLYAQEAGQPYARLMRLLAAGGPTRLVDRLAALTPDVAPALQGVGPAG